MSTDYEAKYVGVTDLNLLKQKRKARRGAVTRQDQYNKTHAKLSLKELMPTELHSKLVKLKNLVEEHEALQNRIEELTEVGEEDTEFLRDSQMLLEHTQVVDELQTLYAHSEQWCIGQTIKLEIESLLHTTSLNSDTGRTSYDSVCSKYSKFSLATQPMLSHPELKNLYTQLDDLNKKLLGKASAELISTSAPPASSSSSTPVSSVVTPQPSRLKLELPKFSGDILDWREFWSIFSARIDRETTLSEHEKISCLESAMQDKDAKAIVRLHCAEGSFLTCVKALQERYDRNKMVYRHHTEKLLQVKPAAETYEGLSKLMHELTRHTGGMKACGGDSFEQLVVALVEPLLPSLSSRLWSDYTSEASSPPALADLVKFLKRRLQAVETVQPLKGSSQVSKIVPPVRNTHRSKNFHVKEQKQDNCPCCHGSHYLYQCSQFRGLTVDKRHGVARKAHVCFNCLSKGHSVEECSSRHTCRECGRKHHSLLHRSVPNSQTALQNQTVPADSPSENHSSSATPPPVVSSSSGTSSAFYQRHTQLSSQSSAYIPATALATVRVPGRQCRARVLLDTGSGITLISSRLAQQLKAKRQRLTHDITGLNGTKCVTSKYAISCTLSSATNSSGEEVSILAHVVDCITSDYGPQELSGVRSLPFLVGKTLADPEFGSCGRIDLLLSIADANRCTYDQSESTPDRAFWAWNSVFGWIVGGQTSSAASSSCLKISSRDSHADEILQLFWQQEEVPSSRSSVTLEEQQALDNFKDTTVRDPQGRFIVTLPKKKPPLTLGESRNLALKRYVQNKKSLVRKSQWDPFHAGLDEYRLLGHAELVPPEDLVSRKANVFYLPTHGVLKESSSTTKLRIVFDGSAPSTNGLSLNDILISGPSLYPLLSTVISQFRRHLIGMSADVSKMFREVGLAEADRDLHRFLHEDTDGQIRDWRMCRVTFGITSSPFLASKVLLQTAEDHKDQYPEAAKVVQNSFYVDDCLTGADHLSDALQLRADLNSLLSLACFTLRKWRSNSSELLDSLPSDLKEVDHSLLSITPSDCPKTLGVHWNSSSDTLHVCTPDLSTLQVPTKRQLASALGRTFDIMGWYTPATVSLKILMQKVWQAGVGWDELLPVELLPTWEKWKAEIPLITSHPVPRKYADSSSPVVYSQLHGFSDASQAAYGAVVYIRLLHQDSTTSVRLVTSKTKVAPVAGNTVPRLELCGALLLAKLLHQVAQDLSIPSAHVFAWCDSSAVLGWINMATTRLKAYVANRVTELVKLISPESWRYVSTRHNPADLASRGVSIQQLLDSTLWWQGPEWLSQPPSQWPRRPDINLSRELPELKPTVLLIQPPQIDFYLWHKFSSFHFIVAVVAWCCRFFFNARHIKLNKASKLTINELCDAKRRLLSLCQYQCYSVELSNLSRGKLIPRHSPLYSLCPLIGNDGLLRVGGRLSKSSQSFNTKHPIVLPKSHVLVQCLVSQIHRDANHAGIGATMAIVSENYYISGLKSLLRKLSRSCVICQRAYARTAEQKMGQLPAERLEAAPPFTYVGVDFAGPLLLKRGNPRKPTVIKSYVCLFLCFSTKAVHVEAVSELTAEAFLAALTRFTGRRGVPTTILSDNGTNFVGANNELQELQTMLNSRPVQDAIHSFAAIKEIEWKFSPSRSPHFGGMWESSIRSMKVLLKKIVGNHKLTFEELATVLVEVEATLNSRPLLPAHSTSPDGASLITAGHFLIGRPLCSLPSRVYTQNSICHLKRWNLVNRLIADLWQQWHSTYLQTLQQRHKWQSKQANVCVDDIVLLKESDPQRRSWPLARVMEVFPGQDGLVRVVKILCNGHIYKRAIHHLVPLVRHAEGASPAAECVQACT